MRTVNEIEKEIVTLRDSLLDIHRLEFAKLFKELQVAHSKKRTGTFWARVKELGFAKTTAQRWMEEYDREVGHRGKTNRDGSFPLEAIEGPIVTPNRRGTTQSQLPDGKRVFQLECFVTEEEYLQLIEVVRFLGQEQRLVLRTFLKVAKKDPKRSEHADQNHAVAYA